MTKYLYQRNNSETKRREINIFWIFLNDVKVTGNDQKGYQYSYEKMTSCDHFFAKKHIEGLSLRPGIRAPEPVGSRTGWCGAVRRTAPRRTRKIQKS